MESRIQSVFKLGLVIPDFFDQICTTKGGGDNDADGGNGPKTSCYFVLRPSLQQDEIVSHTSEPQGGCYVDDERHWIGDCGIGPIGSQGLCDWYRWLPGGLV